MKQEQEQASQIANQAQSKTAQTQTETRASGLASAPFHLTVNVPTTETPEVHQTATAMPVPKATPLPSSIHRSTATAEVSNPDMHAKEVMAPLTQTQPKPEPPRPKQRTTHKPKPEPNKLTSKPISVRQSIASARKLQKARIALLDFFAARVQATEHLPTTNAIILTYLAGEALGRRTRPFDGSLNLGSGKVRRNVDPSSRDPQDRAWRFADITGVKEDRELQRKKVGCKGRVERSEPLEKVKSGMRRRWEEGRMNSVIEAAWRVDELESDEEGEGGKKL